MRIGLLGTGNLAVALGGAWAGAGYEVAVTGRRRERADDAAARIGRGAVPVSPDRLAAASDVVAVAVAYEGLMSALTLVGGPDGTLAGRTVIDCTNPVDFATGELVTAAGSAAESVAEAAPGAHVVKALHLFAGPSWPYTGPAERTPVVAVCGDDAGALDQVAELIDALGARTAVLGGLGAARQAEEVAGFVMRVVRAGANPRYAVPDVHPAA